MNHARLNQIKNSTKDAISVWPVLLTAVCLAGIIFFLSFYRISDPDLWMYLRSGEIMVSDGEPLLTDIYSSTRLGGEWINHSWLSQLILYFFYRFFRIAGLYLFRCLILLSTFTLIFVCVRKKIGAAGSVWLTLAAILACSQRFFIRPELCTFLFLVLVVYLLEKYRSYNSARLFIIPFLFTVWANCHGGFVIGLAVLFIYSLGEGVRALFPSSFSRPAGLKDEAPSRWFLFFLIFLASAGLSAVNPNGLKTFLYFFRIRSISSFIYSWQPFPLTDPAAWGLSQFFFPLFVLAGGVSFVGNRKKIYLPHLILFFVFAALGLKAGRNIFLFALVAPVIIAGNLKNIPGFRRSAARLSFINYILLPAVLAAAIIYPLCDRDPLSGNIHRPFGWGISDTAYPRQCADFIRSNRLPGPLFNTFGIGGYLIGNLYPDWKVYVDSRLSVYGLPFLLRYNRMLLEPTRFGIEAENRRFRMALVDHYNPSNDLLLRWLENSPEWELACFDSNSVLYLYIADPETDFTALIEEGIKESTRVKGLSPRQAYLRGLFSVKIERGEPALFFLRRARRAYPDSAGVLTALARAHLIRQNWPEARAAVEKAIRRGGDNAAALLIQAHLDLASGRWNESIASARRALRLDPTLWGGYQILGDACLKTGKDDLALQAYLKEWEVYAGAEPAIKLADLYFNRKNYAAAAGWYEKIPPGHSAYPLSRIYLAGCYAQQKDYDRSRKIYRAAAGNYPEYSQICFFNLARISLRQGKEEEARGWLEKIEDPGIRAKAASDKALSGIIEK